MTPTERRQRILEALCLRRHDTCDNLAREFHVSNATIRRDIGILMCAYPVETVCGRYGGGVKIADTYYPYRKTLNAKQVKLLIELSTQLDGDDLATISSIIFQLAP
ncbi:DeoR family transcriptional regulator [Oscillospiraceae bacterium 44-34]